MKRTKTFGFILLLVLLLTCISSFVKAEDLVFDSFAEAEKAAEIRAAEYDKRMKEHIASVNKAWEKQKADLGEGSNYDITKITDTRTTEQTSENEENTKLQGQVTQSINDLKKQMIAAATANTVGFAGAAAAYSWRVEFKDGKYVLSDTYDQAMFVTGADGNTTNSTTGNGPEETSPAPPQPASWQNPNEAGDDNEDEEPEQPEPQVAEAINEEPVINDTELTSPDRVVEIIVQHPTTFEEAVFSVSEGQEAKTLSLDKFAVPEDTRVKISAKANMEIENTSLTMTIIDDEGESEPIDSDSMRNYRHLFRIPSDDKYSVNIYVNESGKEARKIMQLRIPVAAVDFDARTISR